jgi:hypothetical protein
MAEAGRARIIFLRSYGTGEAAAPTAATTPSEAAFPEPRQEKASAQYRCRDPNTNFVYERPEPCAEGDTRISEPQAPAHSAVPAMSSAASFVSDHTFPTTFPDGTYLVGTDISPGTYRSSNNSECSWKRLSGFTGSVDDTIAIEINTPIVTILSTDKEFRSVNCGTWNKIEGNSARPSPAAPSATTTSSASAAPQSGATEEQFIALVQAAMNKYTDADNDMAKGGVHVWRKNEICKALSSLDIENWNGQIYSLSSNSDGKGVVEIAIAPNIYVKTWNNSLSDISDHTLIEPGTTVFRILSNLKKGDRVRFSGKFLRNDVDCVREGSMTQSGSMTEPEFIFQFSNVAAVD